MISHCTQSPLWLNYRGLCLCLVLAVCLLAIPCAGASESDPNEPGMFDASLMAADEFFKTTLPGTLGKYNLVLDFNPKVGDFFKRNFVRFPFLLRYGFAESWELRGGITPVTPNPFKSGVGRKWSFGEYRLGIRHDLAARTPFWEKTTIGLDYRAPLGNPPVDLIDGYAHIRPFITMARPVLWEEFTLLYLNLSYDHSIKAPLHSSPPPAGVIRRHETDITPGILFKPTQWGYFAEYTLRFIEEPMDNRRANIYTVGLIWDPSRSQTFNLGLPGKWQFDLGYRLTDEQGRSIRHSIVLNSRWRGNVKEIMGWRDRMLNRN